MAKNKKTTELTCDELEHITFDAMRVHGVLPPTIEEVAALDAELSDVELPFGPSDPDALLKKLDVDANVGNEEPILSFFTAMQGTSRNLAQAARQGGELTDDIRQRMADDKARFLQDEHDKE